MAERVTVAVAADLMGVSRQAVHKAIDAFSPVREGNSYLIPLSALPRHAQIRFHELQKEKDRQERKASDGTNLAEIIEAEGQEAVTEALRREVFVRQALEYTGNDATSQRQSAARMAGVSLATLYRWIKTYEERGFIGILDSVCKRKPKQSKGYGSRSFDNDAIEYGKKLYLSKIKPTLAWIYERVEEKAAKEGWKIGSRASFYRAINDAVSYAEEVMGREGVEAYRKKVMPKILRKRPQYANQIWVGDHHQFDFFIAYKGKMVRPWLTAWMDMTTSAIVGWSVNVNPSSNTIAVAFRHGVLPKENEPFCGLPAEVYVDNGKDYRSKRLDGAFSKLRVTPTYCEAYSPWAKPVERIFGTVADRFSRFAPAYIGNSPENKPERAYEDAKKLFAQGKLWTLEEAAGQFKHWLATDYHTRVHSGIQTTPLDAFRKKQKARLDVPDDRTLDVCLMQGGVRHVVDEGFRFQNFWYAAPEIWDLNGETVTIYYDPNRLGELVVYHNGSFCCVAACRELLEMGASQDDLKEFLTMRRKRQKDLERYIKEANKTLEQVVEERRAAGARSITGGNSDSDARPPVVTLTGHEAAGAALAKHKTAGKPGKRAKSDIADEYIKALGEG